MSKINKKIKSTDGMYNSYDTSNVYNSDVSYELMNKFTN